jgi:osmotically-inducible protein OsmY
VVTFLLGLLGGASAMWLFDAERGERRRVLLSAQIEQTLNNAVKSLEDAAQQLRDQAQHTTNETEQPLSENAADQALAADVRSIVADYVTDTHAISVTVHDGTAILGGKIHAHEAQPLVERVRSLPGVRSVENRMELHDTPIAPQGWTDPTRSGLG